MVTPAIHLTWLLRHLGLGFFYFLQEVLSKALLSRLRYWRVIPATKLCLGFLTIQVGQVLERRTSE